MSRTKPDGIFYPARADTFPPGFAGAAGTGLPVGWLQRTQETVADALAGRGVYKTTVLYTTSGVFDKADHPNLTRIVVTVVGGGGGGGGVNTQGANQFGEAGGGGGGGVTMKVIGVAELQDRELVTVGAGGAGGSAVGGPGGAGGLTRFGFPEHCSATGGGGASGVNVNGDTVGGTGGAGLNGTVNLTGDWGGPGNVVPSVTWLAMTRGGGNTFAGSRRNVGFPGAAGYFPGGGGVGAIVDASSPGLAGGAGAAGMVTIDVYTSVDTSGLFYPDRPDTFPPGFAGTVGSDPGAWLQRMQDTVQAALPTLETNRQMAVFTASGSFVKASFPGLKRVRVTVVGGGGGGGGAPATGAGQAAEAAGGGAGGTVIEVIEAAALAASETVTVGGGGAGGAAGANNGSAGGTSSFGAHCSATGGAGGAQGVVTSGNFATASGLGGSGSGGLLNLNGSEGHNGQVVNGLRTRQGHGGRSTVSGVRRCPGGAGSTGYERGGGGSAASVGASTAAAAGGAGAAGVVVVEVVT
jgi:hypothetical protein